MKSKQRYSNLNVEIGLIVPIFSYFTIMSLIAFKGSDLLLANFFHDDAFFYIKTAQNISVGLGSTFDGLNQTNGYHPLWLLILVLIAKFNPFYGFEGLRVLFLVQGILVCSISLVGSKFLSVMGVSVRWRFIFTISMLGFLGFSDLGVESALFALLVFLSLFVSGSLLKEGRNLALEFCLVILSILTILSRLDGVIFQLMLTTGILVKSVLRNDPSVINKSSFRLPLLIAMPSLLTLMVFGGYNYVTYGHFETISSHLKTGFPGSLKTGWFEQSVIGIKVRMLGVLFLGMVVFTWLIRRQGTENNPVEGVLASAMLYLVVHPVILYFVASGGIASWYFTLDIALAILGGTYLGDRLERYESSNFKLWSGARLLLIAMALSFIVIYLYPRFHNPHRLPQLATAQWLKDNVAASEAIFQVDGTGFTAYFSKRSVINGDGLINGWEYQKVLESDELLAYLYSNGVRWIVCHSSPVNGSVSLTIPAWNGPAKHVGVAFDENAKFVSRNYSVYSIDDFLFARSAKQN